MPIPDDWLRAVPGIVTAAIAGLIVWARSLRQDSASAGLTEAQAEGVRTGSLLAAVDGLRKENERLSARLEATIVRLDFITKAHEDAMQLKDARIVELESAVQEGRVARLNVETQLSEERARVRDLTERVRHLERLLAAHGITEGGQP